MKIDMTDWKAFLVDDVFDIINGKGITTEEIENNPGNLEAVQSGEGNNGVMGHIDKAYCQSKGYSYCEEPCLTVARSGTSGFVSFHRNGCVVGDSAKILLLKESRAKTIQVYLFMQTLLAANRFKYTYGRKVTETLYKNTVIKLPIMPNGKPDWQWMESYIDSLHSKALTSANAVGNGFRLNTEDWREFLLADYFDIVPGKYHYPDEYEEGNTPYYSATNENNGIAQNISLKPDFSGNCIVTGKIGCTAFYVPDDFCATSDVNIFKPKFCMTPYIGLFVASVINLSENYKWAYGRQCRVGNSKKIRIKLPATPDGKPDWQWMESYIKSLPYGDRL